MARGAWNKTLTVYYGPTSVAGVPGVAYRFDVPCRVVYQNKIVQSEYPDSITFAWVTYPDPEFNFAKQTSVGAGVYTYDFGAADQVEIDDDPGVRLVVLRGEEVFPAPRPSYFRALVADLSAFTPPLPPPPPPPPPPPTPGPTCPLAEDVLVDVAYTSTIGPGDPPQWWRIPGGAAFPTPFMTTNQPLPPFGAPQTYSGSSCGSQLPNPGAFLHTGCYSITCLSGPDFWYVVNPPGGSPFTYTWKLSTTTC